MQSITFITGNHNKYTEVVNILSSYINVKREDIELPELQVPVNDITTITKNKAIHAYNLLKTPVIVEDTSLCVNSLNGLPGPYIKWFIQSMKSEGISKLVLKYDDHTAYTNCVFGYMDETLSEPLIFIGTVEGKIVQPQGNTTFGYDNIFVPKDYHCTFAQMDYTLKDSISHRRKALDKLIEYLKTKKID